MRRNHTATIRLLASAAYYAAPAAAQPAIVSGAIATPIVDVTHPPGAPAIDLIISGKAAIIGFLLQGPSGEFASQDFIYHPGFPAHAHLRGFISSQYGTNTTPNQAFSLYTEPGKSPGRDKQRLSMRGVEGGTYCQTRSDIWGRACASVSDV